LTPPPPSTTSTLSLHDALPIFRQLGGLGGLRAGSFRALRQRNGPAIVPHRGGRQRPFAAPALSRYSPHSVSGIARSGPPPGRCRDRKSTRLNSSHVSISYAVFC